MTTILRGDPPADIQAALDRRRALGLDLYDEVWEGTYVVNPAPRFAHANLDSQLSNLLRPLAMAHDLIESGPFNLGVEGDFRVPDRGVHRGNPSGIWLDTAAIVVEIVSPHDATWDKFDFYAERQVDEILIVDIDSRNVQWFALTADGFTEFAASTVLDIPATAVADAIDWPTES